jgi:hypothetical protein
MRTTETYVSIRSLARPGGIVSRGSPAHYELGAYGEPAGCFNGSARPLAYASGLAGRTYAENRPYLLPDTLGELAGPVTGVIQLPLRLDWSDHMVFHLEEPAERNLMYERVIREATRADDLRSYLNESVLRQVWSLLFLPRSVRHNWEQRFPDLRLDA